MKGVEQQQPGGEVGLHATGDIKSEEEKRCSSSEFDAAEVERLMGVGGDEESEIWLNNDASIFCDFPLLPDFPCMSSSSSSSSTPLPVKAPLACSSSSVNSTASSSTSSSAASWAVLSSTDSMEIPHHHHHDVVLVDGMDVMENFGYMDLLDNNDFFDPSSIFHHDDTGLQEFEYEKRPQPQPQPQPQQQEQQTTTTTTTTSSQQVPTMMYNIEEGNSDDDLAKVFLEWLKTNKETVSAEDLRKVKIKKATIECAAKRLGGGKEAMKQLLTLILQWVQANHLHHKSRIINKQSSHHHNISSFHQTPNNSFPVLLSSEPPPPPPPNSISAWNNIPLPPYVSSDPGFAPVVGYMTSDPFANGAPNISSQPPPPADYLLHQNRVDSAQTWPASQFQYNNSFPPVPDNNPHPVQAHAAFPAAGYPNDQIRLVRLGSSATKEARKKRMARQRRFAPHHRNHHNHQQNQQQNQTSVVDHQQHARLLVNESCVINPAANWIYWPSSVACGGGVASNIPPVVQLPGGEIAFAQQQPTVQLQGQQTYQRHQVAASDHRRQGWKTEKNLRFLLQKVLKQSDVGNLGRIVLPKKEAETHLPGLEARDGISIAMEDIGTSRVWNMRYRFWPNNKSRMYLLENTGDFVRTNGLQEGDFIVIYSDVKCGKYLIRGVKVRQSGAKPETKRPGKSQKNQHANSPASAITQTVK